MKERYQSMDEVFKDAEKTRQEEAFQKASVKDSPEKIAEYTIASAKEEKFEASVNGHKVEVEKEKDDKNKDKVQEAEEQTKDKRRGLGVGQAAMDGITTFGTAATFSLINNDALNKTGIPRAMEQTTDVVLKRLTHNAGKER